MTDERTEREDQAILLALEMAPGRRPGAGSDEAAETLVRLYTETVGMLPHALEPLPPSPGLKGRVLMGAAGDETQEVKSPLAQRATAQAMASRATPARTRPGASLPPTSPVVLAPPSRWPLRIAATLAVGLLGVSGWLGWQMQEQSGELGRLRAEAKQAKERDVELARLRDAMKGMESNVALVSSPSVLVCPLHPATGTTAAGLGSRAVLYVAADHQHWYFTARGLKESPAGQEYQIWFVADGRPISGGTFSLKPGEAAHLSSATMPAGTNAISITLERKGGSVLPTGPQVLFGDQMQQVS